jgi:SAM-dependent methyltransferase
MKKPKKCTLCEKKLKNPLVVSNNIYGDKKKSKAFYHCTYCDVRFMYPRLTLFQEKYFYKKEFESFMNKRSGKLSGWLSAKKHVANNKETFQRRYKYLNKHIFKKNLSILEIGCSSGFMLYPLRKKGHHCTGVEPSGFFTNFLDKNKIVNFDSIEELNKKNLKFDLIIHFFVLEHITEPLIFLKKLLTLLKKNGKIIFEVPNVADPLHSIYRIKEFEKFYWSIAHPWYFSYQSLKFLLDKLNYKFEIKFDQRYDLSNHLNWLLEGKPGGMKKYSHLFGKNLEKKYKDKMLKTKRCDTLIGIIKKN